MAPGPKSLNVASHKLVAGGKVMEESLNEMVTNIVLLLQNCMFYESTSYCSERRNQPEHFDNEKQGIGYLHYK